MRAYINGQLSNSQDTFLLASLWFASEDCEDNMEISDKCIRIDGLFVEGTSDTDEFSCRWKGVELCYVNSEGEYIETEDFTVEEFQNLIKEKNMRLVNGDAYFDSNVDVKITEFKLVEEKEFELDVNLIDEIEFIV